MEELGGFQMECVNIHPEQQRVRLKLRGLVKDILTGHKAIGHSGCVSCLFQKKQLTISVFFFASSMAKVWSYLGNWCFHA